MFSYIGLIVSFLWKVGLWDLGQLKNTIYWTLSVGALSLFRISKISEDDGYFRNVIRENFRVVMIIEFVAVFYAFSFLVEIVLLPVVAFFSLMLAVSQNKEEHHIVAKFLTNIMFALGLLVLGVAIFKIISEPTDFFNFQTLRDIYTPPLLSVLLLPYVFSMVVYVGYENAFIRMGIKIKDAELTAYAKRRSVLSFGADVTSLKRWSHSLFTKQIENKNDLDVSIAEIRKLRSREAAPEEVPYEEGWSPYRAKNFLADVGLPTGFYHKIMDGLEEWSASSSYLDIGTSVFPNRVSYYVDGNEYVATSLKLVLDVNNPEDADSAFEKLNELVGTLFEKAFKGLLPEDIEEFVLEGPESEVMFQTKIVKMTREDWGSANGYTVKVIIKNDDEDQSPPKIL